MEPRASILYDAKNRPRRILIREIVGAVNFGPGPSAHLRPGGEGAYRDGLAVVRNN